MPVFSFKWQLLFKELTVILKRDLCKVFMPRSALAIFGVNDKLLPKFVNKSYFIRVLLVVQEYI